MAITRRMEEEKEVLGFVNPEKGARHYVRRYLNEPKYKDWFHRNYPGYTIYRGIGISEEEFKIIVRDLAEPEDPRPTADAGGAAVEGQEAEGLTRLKQLAKRIKEEENSESFSEVAEEKIQPRGEDLAKTVFSDDSQGGSYDRRTFEEFVDERVLVSRDLFGKKEMKIKILEVSDEIQESKIRWKFGDRVKVNKILITIKHLDSMEVEEGEFDIEAIEKELAEKRHYSSTNRWIPSGDIKNGYVVNSKHTALISDAVALDYIVF